MTKIYILRGISACAVVLGGLLLQVAAGAGQQLGMRMLTPEEQQRGRPQKPQGDRATIAAAFDDVLNGDGKKFISVVKSAKDAGALNATYQIGSWKKAYAKYGSLHPGAQKDLAWAGIDKGITPLTAAVLVGNVEATRALLKVGQVATVGEGGAVIMKGAVDVNTPAYDTNQIAGNGPSALMIAVAKNDVPMTKLLLEHGANYCDSVGSEQPHYGKAVFCFAIDAQAADALRVLITHRQMGEGGAFGVPSIDAYGLADNPRGTTFGLHGCNLIGYLVMVSSELPAKVLEDMWKAIVDAWGRGVLNGPVGWQVGFTPLMFAIKLGDVRTVELLVRLGADVDVKNTKDGNKTACDYARASRNKELTRLVSKGKNQCA